MSHVLLGQYPLAHLPAVKARQEEPMTSCIKLPKPQLQISKAKPTQLVVVDVSLNKAACWREAATGMEQKLCVPMC